MTIDSHKMGVLFKDNKYTKWYMNIVERAKNRVLGRIRKEVPKWRKPNPIETPLGIFNHPLDFCEKYLAGQGIFDNLDSKIRKRKSNQYLREELESVGYDFSKTKSENGFYWK